MVIIVAGRPLDIKNYIAEWDGVVVSCLPGSEAMGVTDTLFGDYQFVGRLPVAWPL